MGQETIEKAGIAKCGHDAAEPAYYHFNSRFDGVIGGQRVTVFAGALRGDPTQGVLLVRALPADGKRRGRQINGPAGAGTLKLVGSKNGRMQVLAQRGDSIWVDLPAAHAVSEKHIA